MITAGATPTPKTIDQRRVALTSPQVKTLQTDNAGTLLRARERDDPRVLRAWRADDQREWPKFHLLNSGWIPALCDPSGDMDSGSRVVRTFSTHSRYADAGYRHILQSRLD